MSDLYEMPALNKTIKWSLDYPAEDAGRIKQGFVPKVMEERWLILYKDNRLYFYRSWTGHCIYIVPFREEQGKLTSTEVIINQDPEQFRWTDEKEEMQLIRALIKRYLLGK